MTLDGIPLFAMLKSKMGYETQRERVLGQNIANADTPNYAPSDLKAFDFGRMVEGGAGGLAPVRTNAMHLAGRTGSGSSALTPQVSPDSEARLDGNQVVLEEQMMKMSDARGDYDAAITLYQNAMTLLRTAAKRPGG